MNKKFVKITFELDCEWTGPVPAYRVYVDGELFTERSYIWKDQYLEEMLQIEAEPGRHRIDFENLNSDTASFTMRNCQVLDGPAKWLSKKYLEIHNES